MSILFDDYPVMLFASAAGLIMCFKLVFAIRIVRALSEKDEKHVVYFKFAFPREDVKMSA